MILMIGTLLEKSREGVPAGGYKGVRGRVPTL